MSEAIPVYLFEIVAESKMRAIVKMSQKYHPELNEEKLKEYLQNRKVRLSLWTILHRITNKR